MSVVRFHTPRSFFGSNRRPRPPAAIWGMLRVLWPCFFNFLLIRSLNRRKASRVDRERGLSYPRVLPLLCRPGFFDLRSNRPCAGPRPFFYQRSIYFQRPRKVGPRAAHEQTRQVARDLRYHYKNTLTPLRFSRIRHHLSNRKFQQGNKGQEKESGEMKKKLNRPPQTAGAGPDSPQKTNASTWAVAF